MRELAADTSKLDALVYSAMLYETTNLFKKMGSAMSMAFSDITEKAAIVKHNLEVMEKVHGLKHVTIQDTIHAEIEMKVIQLNGENNHKLLGKAKKGSWEWDYTSTTRTILRTMWLLDFITILFKMLLNDRAAHLSHCARTAYNEGLGIHHPWVVRQAAKLAMYAAPSRKALIESSKITYEHVEELVGHSETLRQYLWALYREKSLTTLP